MDWEKYELIKNIENKLNNGIRLNEAEINSVITALFKAKGYAQEPYFELIYHDEYNKKKRSIAYPSSTRIIEKDGKILKEECFEITVERLLEGDKQNDNQEN